MDTYTVKYTRCRVCGADDFKLLGIRGNKEFFNAPALEKGSPHMITNVVKCNACHFVYTNPIIMTQNQPSLYRDPDEYVASCAGRQERLFKEAVFLLEKYAKKGRLLDIGSGKGEFLAQASVCGWDVYGVEESVQFADYSRRVYGLGVESKPFSETRYPDSYFNAVTLNMVLEHIDDPNRVIEHISRILADDGALLIEVPNMDSLLLKAIRLLFFIKGRPWSPLLSPLHKPYHAYGYSKRSLKYLLNRHQFKICRIKYSTLFNRGIKEMSVSRLLGLVGLAIGLLGSVLGLSDVISVIAKKRKAA